MTDPREESETELSLETERALSLALRSAWQPGELDPARHEALLALCLEDPFAEPTPEELLESERLRDALETGGDHPDAALARALRASHSPDEAPRALPELPKELETKQAPPTGRVVYVVFGAATTLLAAAAAIALVVGRVAHKEESMAVAQKSEGAAPAAAAPAAEVAMRDPEGVSASGESLSRSSAPLFHEPFTLDQTTARIDRIAAVRERELRSNLYRSWGLK
jgi:hypothetical protein